MAAIHGACVPVFRAEQGFAVDEPDVPIARCDRVVVGLPDDGTTGTMIPRVPEVAFRHHDHRQIRLLFPNGLEERLMSLLQMFRGRCVVVVIHDKGREFESGNRPGDRDFAPAGTGKAQVDLRGVDGAAEHRGVGIAGTRGAAALRDR
jgi:hypothetical protein